MLKIFTICNLAHIKQANKLRFIIQSRYFVETQMNEKYDLNIKIKRLAKQKCNPHQLVQIFDQIQQEGIEYDHITYLIAQKALITIHCQNKHIRSAKKLWQNIINNDMYKDKLEERDYFVVISTFCANNYTATALQIFDEMQNQNMKCQPKLYNFVITAAAKLKSLEKANTIYEILLKNDPHLIKNDTFIQNGLINMFLSCKDLQSAQKIFQSLSNKRTAETWNILINGMSEDTKYTEAINLFNQMVKQNNIYPNCVTYSCVAKAVSKLQCVDEANKLYTMIENDNNINIYENIGLCNSLITMFSKCEVIEKAVEIFEYVYNNKKCIMNIRTWNSMVTNYYNAGNYEEVINLYKRLMVTYRRTNGVSRKLQIKPQLKTYRMFVESCKECKDMEMSKRIYNDIRELYNIVADCELYNALIDMYCKCNGLDDGIEIWREMMKQEPSVAKFTYMIRMCIDYGNNMKAFELFDEMQNVYNIKPDATAFVTILRACGKHEVLIKRMHELIIKTGEELCDNKHIARTLITAYNVCGNKEMSNQILKGL